MSKELEEGIDFTLDWTKLKKVADRNPDVVPVAVQNVDTREVILLAYANEEALQHSIKTGNATFWSTSRRELWEKGATSGETFELLEIRTNCEQNSLLFIVRPRRGGICHTKTQSGAPRSGCYYRKLDFGSMTLINTNP
ncbi:MAG: phosphoribosyl-AMP cyclohydrolase [Verrucomicrobia bacterium]|nr:phosphoribosyl-AMP cyclohydrolase [Verrucomicrobiota bacterium]MCH8512194.1 phosphoribosyl-AMP cyclohydrolase [Kiritimatiellia bacterium]